MRVSVAFLWQHRQLFVCLEFGLEGASNDLLTKSYFIIRSFLIIPITGYFFDSIGLFHLISNHQRFLGSKLISEQHTDPQIQLLICHNRSPNLFSSDIENCSNWVLDGSMVIYKLGSSQISVFIPDGDDFSLTQIKKFELS